MSGLKTVAPLRSAKSKAKTIDEISRVVSIHVAANPDEKFTKLALRRHVKVVTGSMPGVRRLERALAHANISNERLRERMTDDDLVQVVREIAGESNAVPTIEKVCAVTRAKFGAVPHSSRIRLAITAACAVEKRPAATAEMIRSACEDVLQSGGRPSKRRVVERVKDLFGASVSKNGVSACFDEIFGERAGNKLSDANLREYLTGFILQRRLPVFTAMRKELAERYGMGCEVKRIIDAWGEACAEVGIVWPRSSQSDNDFTLVVYQFPQMAKWRTLAVDWLATKRRNYRQCRNAVRSLMLNFLVPRSLDEPKHWLSRTAPVLPMYEEVCVAMGNNAVIANNILRDFIEFVLLKEFSVEDDNGRPVVVGGFHNPVALKSLSGLARHPESVHTPLPYGFISELREMIVQGPNFTDWRFAQTCLDNGPRIADWFPIEERLLDKRDPDCVWRVRDRKTNAGPVLEIWNPSRWVALLIKLATPLRTFQVRMLDSGEADTWKYEGLFADEVCWSLNRTHLRKGTERKPWENGVFRRIVQLDGSVQPAIYVNTNKTADAHRSGPAKGFVMPWPVDLPIAQNPYYWMQKLRDWQSRYNPIENLTAWSEIPAEILSDQKSESQLAQYADTAFLFRLGAGEERRFPVSTGRMRGAWATLLRAYEERLAARNETHADGSRIRLTEVRDNRAVALFPLHALRVSLITALAVQGGVPLEVLQKVVGHSRLLMTLYYTKINATMMMDYLSDGIAEIDKEKDKSLVDFLRNARYEQLVSEAICNSREALSLVIDQEPTQRNAAAWSPQPYGLCLVGGNSTPPVEGSTSVKGCHNGGPIPSGNQSEGPVPGGPRNCVRCRWFVTEPHYLPALVSHANWIIYRLNEAAREAAAQEEKLARLRRSRAAAEAGGSAFVELHALRTAERLCETYMARFALQFENLSACMRLINRCTEVLNDPKGDTQLVAVGSITDVAVALDETDSELLQLSGICFGAEIYPNEHVVDVVTRRSQLLDQWLINEGKRPLFLALTPSEQLLVGNALQRSLAQRMNPENPSLGHREVVSLLDANVKISERLGVSIEEFIPDCITASRPVALASLEQRDE